MEPRREKPKAPKPRAEEKTKRFRIVKLEERIASRHGHATKVNCSQECGSTLSIE
jgi:hypothetical protein